MVWNRIHSATLVIVIAALIFIFFKNNVKLQSTGFLKKYTVEEITYFSEVGFGDSDRLMKWNKEIQVQILPPFQKADSIEVDKIVDELKPLVRKVKIVLVKEKGNFLVHFPRTAKEFNSYRQVDSRQEPRGFASPNLDLQGNLRKVEIYIMPYLNGKGRGETLRHEFCHAMGLMGHSKRSFEEPHLLGITVYNNFDVYESDLDSPASLPEAERRAIKLLYDDHLPVNLSRSKFLEAIGK